VPWQNTKRAGADAHSASMTDTTRRGRMITVEGIDGAGKSTHLPLLKELLERRGRRTWLTREPGGTPLGERLRALLLREEMAPLTEALLMFAARREHCEREIWPRLDAGSWVLCDRFPDATYAYQGGGHGVPVPQIEALERVALGDFHPDLTLIFDVPASVGHERLADGRALDKFESQETAFFDRVRATYLTRATAEPQRCRIIDSTRPVASVRAELEAIVAAL
jgi:dTMP kinase